MVIGIIIGSIFIALSLFCVWGAIVSYRAKKNPKKETQSVKTPAVHESEIQGKINEIDEQINTYRFALVEKMRSINDKMQDISKKTYAFLMEYITKYKDDETIDSDFAELLSIYERRQNSVNDEYLSALQKCNDKKLPETKTLCDLENARKMLQDEFKSVSEKSNEWSDVQNLKAREVWSDPECEKLYNQLYALKNDAIYKERQEKSTQWKDYSTRSIIGTQGGKICHIGRSGDNVAIWDNDYNGKVVSIDDIQYFQVSEKTTTSTYTSSSGKPSKLGTAINEAIFGTAAATASAINKSQQNTTTFTSTNKKAMIYFKFETGFEPFEVDLNSQVDKLIAMMPEKQR